LWFCGFHLRLSAGSTAGAGEVGVIEPVGECTFNTKTQFHITPAYSMILSINTQYQISKLSL